MENRVRTAGDGVENLALKENVAGAIAFDSINLNKESYNNILRSLRPVEVTSKLIPLIPKYMPRDKKVLKSFSTKPKDPKFVPYEPYKAAVKPVNLCQHVDKKTGQSKSCKNDAEIQSLVSQVVEMRKTEMSRLSVDNDTDDTSKLKIQWAKEKQGLEVDIRNLKETNLHLENQLKFQAQVNSELKTLLVAAVGEDLESRVQHLTEDKLALARALLNSANHLTSHQEQTEWLSGQCEVWRSKFLASSLMVEELAKWKSALSNRIHDLQEVIKNLLRDFHRIRNSSIKTCKNLIGISNKIFENDIKVNSKSKNVIEIVTLNDKLSTDIVNHLKIEINELLQSKDKFHEPTLSEKTAEMLLQNPVSISGKQDILCKAVLGAATSLGSSQVFLQHPGLHSCCAHCKGEIQVI